MTQLHRERGDARWGEKYTPPEAMLINPVDWAGTGWNIHVVGIIQMNRSVDRGNICTGDFRNGKKVPNSTRFDLNSEHKQAEQS